MVVARKNYLVFILTIGVFGILNTEMGVIGILPLFAERFHVSISEAGLLVSLFALAIAVSGPTLPLLFSGLNRKKVMLLVLGVFTLSNLVSIFAADFTTALIARVIPAFFHPIYCSAAFTVAASSVNKENSAQAVSKVMMGVSAGMALGIPISNYIAGLTSYEIAILYFTAINAIAFVITLLFVPSLPVKERLSYGAQVSELKKSLSWVSITGVVFISAAMAGVYSYLAEYLEVITQLSGPVLSLLLFLFGIAGTLGNFIAGKLLVKHPMRSLVLYPFAAGAVYVLFYFMGSLAGPMAAIVFVWGALYGMNCNIQQYLMVSAMPKAPDFANGLFISCGNLGITIGTTAGGFFIAQMGTHEVVFAGLLFLALTFIAFLVRNYLCVAAQNPQSEIFNLAKAK